MIFNRLDRKETNLLAFLLERLRHLELSVEATEIRKSKDLKHALSAVVDAGHRLLKLCKVDISEVWATIRPAHTIDDCPGRRSQVFDAGKGLTYLVRYQPMELSNEVGRDYGLVQFDTQRDVDHFFETDPSTAGKWHIIHCLDKIDVDPVSGSCINRQVEVEK